MKKTLTLIAATAILGSTALAPLAASSAFAQSATSGAGSSAPASTMAPVASGTTAYLTMQSADEMAASNYIGQSVYTPDNKEIGKINDLILKNNGGIVAAVVGVGGFLGLGAKNVALPIEKITAAPDAANAGKIHLTTTETAETLKAAPEFKSLEDQQAEKAANMPASAPTTK